MRRYVIQRLLSVGPVLLGMVTMVFVLLRVLPGEPTAVLAAQAGGGGEDAARLRAQYGLDRPLVVQYARYLLDLATGKLGRSLFTQQRVFTMQSYRLLQRGPVFTEDTEISLERSGKYRVKTKARKDGREEVLDGTLDLPPDVYNGMVLTVAKNLPKGASETIHIVAFTPMPRLIQLELAPAGEHKVLIGELAKTAIQYVFKPQLGVWLSLFATVLGGMPPDYRAWIITDEVPAFARFEGPLYTTGPVWRIELTSPRWPD